MESRVPIRAVDSRYNCTIGSNDQNRATSLTDQRFRNALPSELCNAVMRDRNRRCPITGIVVAIEVCQHEINNLLLDATLAAAGDRLSGHWQVQASTRVSRKRFFRIQTDF